MAERPRILVVDDDSRILEIVAFLLRKEDFEVRLAGTGGKAIEEAREFKPDLIVLDINMPGKDGFEVCRSLKSEADLTEIPVVFLTAQKGPDNWEKADRSGGVAYIEKPFRNDALLLVIRQLLEETKGEKKG